MNIREYNKDHLKERAGVMPAAPVEVDAPQSGDPLLFWTQHEKDPIEVNLHPLANGQRGASQTGGDSRFIAFSARPRLILQLAPAIEEAVLYAGKATVHSYLNTLRDWWRILDAVEAAAATAGQPMTRVDDVRLLTQVHSEYAHRSGMHRTNFSKFCTLANATLRALGTRQMYWESPEDVGVQKHIPPEEQRKALRIALKRSCRNVLERWAKSDRLSQIAVEPEDPEEANLYRHVHYMRNIQNKTGKVLPTPNELRDGVPQSTLNYRGIYMGPLRESIFPSGRDADAVWYLCLVNTGWNPSTLIALDATKKFLFDHFKDDPNDSHRRFVLSPQTYELIGEKERAGGKEQVVTGQWKTQDGPGHLIKTYLERVAPLRELLNQQLIQEKLKYEKMEREGAGYSERAAQFAEVKSIEQGCRSVWLHVVNGGNIAWISNSAPRRLYCVNGAAVTYVDEVVHLLNAQRVATNEQRVKHKETLLTPLAPVPRVRAKDFRVWFADYVYRASNGNILQVKKALGHSRLRTSIGYVDSNILNQEASDAARRFLNILEGELDAGRIDLAILAYLYRHGELSPEQEDLLVQSRTLPKSRMNVACKDALHPPSHIKATADEACDVQRCMLCPENAVLLPESLDGIAMRVEELRALQGFLPIGTWAEDRYDIELKNNLMALRKFDLNRSLTKRQKWARAIAAGEHYVPGVPLASSP
ncbi:hypothetical protein [Telluria aromaticivorans]|uniref:Integrase n=1 Tax=Telluria aromaticivorans TaxID=2725995 RepID=A0A7Y2P1R5_9BURK|nr:hypothetical protein [Telluria aromaticivorans]NNG25524.1 hypothetical protein [Telluria aromaticivorans]